MTIALATPAATSRTAAIATYRNIRDSFAGHASRFEDNFAAELGGIDRTDMAAIIALAEQVGSDLNDELQADAWDDAYQNDIDSGWAAERSANAIRY